MSIHTIYTRSADWESVGGGLEGLVYSPDFRIVKRTERTLAGTAQLNGVETFVKCVTYRSWLKGIIARVCGSRARRTIRGAEFLRRIGFASPKALAAFEHRHLGSVSASYVIVEYLHHPKILSRFALADGRDYLWRRRISKDLADAIQRLHASGCYTRDLQETNLMLEMHDGSLGIYFTDQEDFRRLPLVPWQLRLRNLVQLDRSIGRFVSRTHRLRFLRNYLGEQASRSEVRKMVARLLRIRQRTERRQFRRQRSTAIVTPTADGPMSEKTHQVPLTE
jgi:tRNA A-37 threonylcarbamoyl transferase component Bud32